MNHEYSCFIAWMLQYSWCWNSDTWGHAFGQWLWWCRCKIRIHELCHGKWRWLIVSMGWDVSEPRPPTRLFIRWVTCERGEPWWWWCRLGMNSWLVHQSSLAVYQQRHLGASRRNGRRSENFAYHYLWYVNGFFKCRKILRHGTAGFTYHPKEGVLRIFIALKNPSSWSVWTASLGSSSKLTNRYTTEVT
jgi:hypothetical protein